MKPLAPATLLSLAACAGETGTLSVALATAPGSTLLDEVQTLRMVVTNPRREVTADRSGDGFELAIELPASGESAAILVDGFDASDTLVATGASPRFAFGAITGRVVIYMAAPNSMGVAPTTLEPARSELAAGLLTYGAILAGGAVAGGAASDAVAIYNAYDHSMLSGLPLPAPRAGLGVGVGSFGVYMFGGRDEAGSPSANLWRFDTNLPPSGQYFDYGDKPGFARADQQLVPTGNEHFLVTGSPAAELLGLDGSMIVRDDVGTLPDAGVSVTANDGSPVSIFAGAGGVVRCGGGACALLEHSGRTGADVVPLPGGKVGLVCGSTTALRIDAASGAAEAFTGVPAADKTDCAAATTTRHLVIAGGTLGAAVDGTVEIFDAVTLALVTTGVLAVPRTGAQAIALPNDQVLIAGGVDATGAPIATVELFTPASTQ